MNCLKKISESAKEKYIGLYRANPLITIFISAMVASISVFIVLNIITEGEVFANAFFRDKKDTFMDYFNSIVYSSDSPYTKHKVIYPPLITLFYAYLGNISIPYVDKRIHMDLAFQIRNSQSGIMLFIILMALTFSLLYYLFKKVFTRHGNVGGLLSALICFSFPFFYCLERGNSLIWSVLFLLLFTLNYRSKNKYVRYASYICLGAASGIKVYCILFGLLIVRERNVKEILIAMIMGFALVAFPFVFTDGNVAQYIMNSINVSNDLSSSGSFDNINSILHFFSNVADESIINSILFSSLILLYGICFIISYYGKNTKDWNIIILLSCAISLGFGTGALYNLCIFSIPLVFFLKDENKLTRMNIVYLSLFILMFIWIPAPVAIMRDFTRYLHTLPMFVFLILSAINLFNQIRSSQAQRRLEEDTPGAF